MKLVLPNEILIPQVAEYIAMGKTVTIPLSGYSMRPYLENDRDKALLAAPPHDLKVGDVILAETCPSKWALHRIVAIDGDNITMYGDGNFSPEHIQRKDVIAIARGFYRNGSTHLDNVDTWHYRLYWHTWLHLRPVRRLLLFAWLLCHYPGQAFHKISRKIQRLCR